MKLAVILSVFLPLVAFAEPIHFNGSYVFQGQAISLGRQTVEVVDSRTSAGRARVEALRRAGAECLLRANQAVRCTQFGEPQTVPPSSLRTIQDRYRGMTVTFGPRTGSPVLVSESPTLTEWSIPQRGQWAGGSFERFRYLVLRNRLIKLVLPGREALWLHTEDGHTLRGYALLRVPESSSRWHDDSMEIVLTK